MPEAEPPKGRIKQLLLKCAENMDNGCDPLHHEFLVENQITADECFTLAQQMAVAVRGYAQAPVDLALKVVMSSEFKDDKEREFMLANLERAQSQQNVLKRLKQLNSKP